MTKSTPLLLKQATDGILRLTLNRPGQGNCLSLALLQQITQEITAAGKEPLVKTIIIAASGSMFCSGHDLKELTARRSDSDGGREFYQTTLSACSAMMLAIVDCPKPIIAEVQGPALAAGAQLVATCDLAIASKKARFCLPGVDIGLFCSTPMVAVSRNVSHKHTLEMLLTGNMISARKAGKTGLINRVVPAKKLEAATEALARKIAGKSPRIIALGKRAFYQQTGMGLTAAYEFTTDVMIENMLNAQAKEGIAAFLEKRAPVWPEN